MDLLCVAVILLFVVCKSDAFSSCPFPSLTKSSRYLGRLQFSKISLQNSYAVPLQEKHSLHRPDVALLAVSSLYRVSGKEATNAHTIGSFLTRLINVFDSLNPTQLLGGVYIVLMIGMIITGIIYKSKQLFNKVRGRHDSELQLYECEFCGLEMRPARDRVHQILSKRGFRCAQCGAPGSAFFNTENMGDPRAVARVRRIQKEKKLEQEKLYGKNSSDESDDE